MPQRAEPSASVGSYYLHQCTGYAGPFLPKEIRAPLYCTWRSMLGSSSRYRLCWLPSCRMRAWGGDQHDPIAALLPAWVLVAKYTPSMSRITNVAVREKIRRWPGGPTLLRILYVIVLRLRPEILEVSASEGHALASGGFADLFFEHDGRLVQKYVHYLPIYEKYFAGRRGQPVRFLEIGVAQGGSLQLWRKYFGANAVIFGVDIVKQCRTVADPDVQVRIGSQRDPLFLKAVVEEMGGVDIVVDDGSHQASDQRITFETLFPLLSDGGVYIVEDLHTAYWFSYGGGLRRTGTFV